MPIKDCQYKGEHPNIYTSWHRKQLLGAESLRRTDDTRDQHGSHWTGLGSGDEILLFGVGVPYFRKPMWIFREILEGFVFLGSHSINKPALVCVH